MQRAMIVVGIRSEEEGQNESSMQRQNKGRREPGGGDARSWKWIYAHRIINDMSFSSGRGRK